MGELAKRPDVQEKIRDEIKRISAEKGVEEWAKYRPIYEDLNKMKYIDNTMKEAQRLWPIAPHLVRMANEAENYENFHIPKGVFENSRKFLIYREMCLWMCFRIREIQRIFLILSSLILIDGMMRPNVLLCCCLEWGRELVLGRDWLQRK
jgi:hypothetical protein